MANIRAVCVWKTGRKHLNHNREISTSHLRGHAPYYRSLDKSVNRDDTILVRFIDQRSLEKDFLRIQNPDSDISWLPLHSIEVLTLSHP